jgi:serine/threonine-protein kinase
MLGKYERLDVLGHGVSGIVYLAKDTLLNKQIALKEVDVQAGDVQRFLEEARVMDRLRHPNIVRVNGVDRIGSKVVIDMEYVRGENLQDKLRNQGRLLSEQAVLYAIQILDALDFAHSMQTVHRDIKPANILINANGEVKLVDFGLAEILSTNAYAGGAGTYAYMAPEDFAEEDRSDHQSDIWAVGVTLFEMLTGFRPFQVERGKVKDPFAWKRLLEREPPARLTAHLPEAAPALQAILDRALAKDKQKRYQKAGDFRDDLLRFQQNRSVEPATLTLAMAQENPEGNPAPDWDLRTLPVQTEKGTVVAEIPMQASSALPVPATTNPPAEQEGEEALPAKGRRKREVALQLVVTPSAIDFGRVHQGDLKSRKVQVRVKGAKGGVIGSVEQKPEWVTVHPRAFEQARQPLTITVHSGRLQETGSFDDVLTVVTEAGKAHIPLHLEVLRPRLTLPQIALWYVPILILAVAPCVVGSLFLSHIDHAWLVPPAAVSSAFMCLMLFLLCRMADTQIGTRIPPALFSATLFMVSGAMFATHSATLFRYGHRYFLIMAAVFLLLSGLQLFKSTNWKRWAFLLFCLGVGVNSMLANLLLH